MLDVNQKNWSGELFEATGIHSDIVTQIIQPGTVIGKMSEEIAGSLGMQPVSFVAVAEHDTGSAIVAVPAKGYNWAYLSSGTWSLMGIELNNANNSEKAFKYGFTNEGGVNNTIRFLKNISGMWLLEQCKKEWDKKKFFTYEELIDLAESAEPFKSFINPDAPCFENPVNMENEIKEYCRQTGQQVPETIGQIVRIIFESLAMKYRYTMDMLKELSPYPIERLHIIGGGAKNEMLCRFTANALGMPVIAGPAEATAIGNIMVQAMAAGQISSPESIRHLVSLNPDIKKYNPQQIEIWNKSYPVFLNIWIKET